MGRLELNKDRSEMNVFSRTVFDCVSWFLRNTNSSKDLVVTGGLAYILRLQEIGIESDHELQNLDFVVRNINKVQTSVLEKVWLGYKTRDYLAFLWCVSQPESRLKIHVFTDAFPFVGESTEMMFDGSKIQVMTIERLLAHIIFDCTQVSHYPVDPKQFVMARVLLTIADTVKLDSSWDRWFRAELHDCSWQVAWQNALSAADSNPNNVVIDPFVKGRGILKSLYLIAKYGTFTILGVIYHTTSWDDFGTIFQEK